MPTRGWQYGHHIGPALSGTFSPAKVPAEEAVQPPVVRLEESAQPLLHARLDAVEVRAGGLVVGVTAIWLAVADLELRREEVRVLARVVPDGDVQLGRVQHVHHARLAADAEARLVADGHARQLQKVERFVHDALRPARELVRHDHLDLRAREDARPPLELNCVRSRLLERRRRQHHHLRARPDGVLGAAHRPFERLHRPGAAQLVRILEDEAVVLGEEAAPKGRVVERRGWRVQVALLGGRKPLVVQRHEREAGRRALAARQLAAAVPVGDDEGALDDRAESEQVRHLLEPLRHLAVGTLAVRPLVAHLPVGVGALHRVPH
mmetsp:Transcript_27219/g.87389  ORF Transcript_27219/g.87389 Transcript_27219/m.87389 type:complete len:322 (+) Transcript_27219:183-1148(+)